MRFILATLATLAIATTPAVAQHRTLPVPADKGWQHADSGLILMPRLDGLERTSLIDTTAVERDVAASFDNADRSVVATIYIFHPAIVSVPLWFDRVETAIRDRDLFGGATPLVPRPVAFVPPSGGGASALRQVYTTGKGPFRTTAAAMMPLGPWLVAVRMSAKSLDPAALDAAMTRVIAGLRWPRGDAAPAPVAVPVTACTTPLAAMRAKPVKRAMTNTLMDSLMGLVTAGPAPTPATASPVWCREGTGTTTYGVYRTAGAGYTIALGDACRSIAVVPSIDLQVDAGAPSRVTVLLNDVDDTTATYDSFDRLPLPQQVVDLVMKTAPQSRSEGSRTVTITPPAS